MEIVDIYPRVECATAINIETDDGIFELPVSTVDSLTSIALNNKIGYGAAIGLAIANEAFLLQQVSEGAKLIIEQPNGRMRYLERN